MVLYSLNFSNGKRYIGVSKNPQRRFQNHRRHAAQYYNLPVHNAIRKHGSPELQILCIGSVEYITELETKAIEAYQTQDRRFGYNVSPGGGFIKESPPLKERLPQELIKSKAQELESSIDLQLIRRLRDYPQPSFTQKYALQGSRSSALKKSFQRLIDQGWVLPSSRIRAWGNLPVQSYRFNHEK